MWNGSTRRSPRSPRSSGRSRPRRPRPPAEAEGRQVGRILALDVGERRIGVAVTDPEGVLAQPLEVVERHGWDADLRRVAELARAFDVEVIVVGYPITLRGEVGPQAARVDRFIVRLRRVLDVGVERVDERLTTAAAERSLREADLPRARRRRVRDAVAAALILQSYLDRRRPTEE